MAANPDRGEVDIEIGGKVRTFRFRTAAQVALEDALGTDPMVYLGSKRGMTKFVVEALYAGGVKDNPKLTMPEVCRWLDDYPGEVSELAKKLIYAVVRGKPGAEAKEAAKALDAAFADEAGPAAGAAPGAGPLDAAPAPAPTGTISSS